jgi:hypothetical protein
VSDRIDKRAKTLILGSLRTMVRELDATSVAPADAVALVDWFAEVERLAVAGKALAASAVAERARQAAGDSSAADWLAKRTGTTVAEARSVLDTAARVAPASPTDVAFRSGDLSLKQAEAVSAGASADPRAEGDLLRMAKHESLQKLRDESARVRAAAETDPAARHERIRRSRFWRRWTDAEGARCGAYRLTPEAAAVVEAAAQPFIDVAIDEARRSGDHEPSEAYAADGLVAMAAAAARGASDGGGTEAAPRARGGRGRRRLRDRRELIALVDLSALQRGDTTAGETCEIAGVGPVPVDVARRVFGEALLRIVIRDGKDIRTVVHTGRTANALQETAVLVRAGGRCERPTCALPASEIDHTAGYTATGPTTLDDLGGLCAHDHDLKTRHGHTYERTDDGRIRWRRPDGTVEEERPPP